MKTSIFFRTATIALLAGCLVGPSSAAQVLEGTPNDMLQGVLSRHEPNHVRIDGGMRLRKLHGIDKEFTPTVDEDTGTFFVKVNVDKPFLNIFAADDSGNHWRLFLKVKDVPAESLVIKPRGSEVGKGYAKNTKAKTEPRNALIQKVLQAMSKNADLSDFSSVAVNEEVPLWKEATFLKVREMEGAVRGEKYRLTNITATQMVLDEKEFYRRCVIAVVVDKHDLAPGEGTNVTVVSDPCDDR